MRQHGVGPVLNGVVLLQVQFGYQQINDGNQIGDEHHAFSHTSIEIAAEVGHRKEEIDTCNGADKAIDGDVFALVDQTRKLPYCQACYDAEQQHHSLRSQKAGYDGCHEDDACDGSNDKVLHKHFI